MIVSCPGCGTRYRHQAALEAAARAECSRCDEQFPLVAARRQYVLLPGDPSARPAAPPPPMDPLPEVAPTPMAADAAQDLETDPLFQDTAPDSVEPELDLASPSGAEPVEPVEHVDEEAETQQALEEADQAIAAAAVAEDGADAEDAEEAGEAPVAPARKPRTGLELGLATLLTAAGAGSGYYLAMIQKAGILEWSAGGGFVGAMVSWIMIRWIMRPRKD